MRTSTRALIAATGLWALLGCGGLLDLESLVPEPVPPPSADWIGHWHGEGTDLTINADGTARIDARTNKSETHYVAPIIRWDTEPPASLVFAIGPVELPYDVQQLPHMSGSEWRMVFDGVVLIRDEVDPNAFTLPSEASPTPGATDAVTPPTPPSPAQ